MGQQSTKRINHKRNFNNLNLLKNYTAKYITIKYEFFLNMVYIDNSSIFYSLFTIFSGKGSPFRGTPPLF